MKILLTTLNSKYIHSNLAIRYLRSYCSNLPVEIILKEFNINQNHDYILAEIYKSRADIIAFSCYIWNISSTLQISSTLKQVMPQTRIILGGPEVSFDSENLLKENSFLDFIIRDEGEESFRELLLVLLQKQKPGIIAGVTY
ncbi:MAG: cobalamin B12-binding domain-containing protein, partial [Desulfobacterales bacterium]|nr:cobalamin B12-binding domain-containing protein [Desulfobacterales bacterium]